MSLLNTILVALTVRLPIKEPLKGVERKEDTSWISPGGTIQITPIMREVRRIFADVANSLVSVAASDHPTPVLATILRKEQEIHKNADGSVSIRKHLSLIITANEKPPKGFPAGIEEHMKGVWSFLVKISKAGPTGDGEYTRSLCASILKFCWKKMYRRFVMDGRGAVATALFTSLSEPPQETLTDKQCRAFRRLAEFWRILGKGLPRKESIGAKEDWTDVFGRLWNEFLNFRRDMKAKDLAPNFKLSGTSPTSLDSWCEENKVLLTLEDKHGPYQYRPARHVEKVLTYFNDALVLRAWAHSDEFKSLIQEYGEEISIVLYSTEGGEPFKANFGMTSQFYDYIKSLFSNSATNQSSKPTLGAQYRQEGRSRGPSTPNPNNPAADRASDHGDNASVVWNSFITIIDGMKRWAKNWNKDKKELQFSSQTVHCECAIAHYIVKEGITATDLVHPYIGITKLSCLFCKAYIDAFNKHWGHGQLIRRGCHGGAAVPWCLPDLKDAQGNVVGWAENVNTTFGDTVKDWLSSILTQWLPKDEFKRGGMRRVSASTNRSDLSDPDLYDD